MPLHLLWLWLVCIWLSNYTHLCDLQNYQIGNIVKLLIYQGQCENCSDIRFNFLAGFRLSTLALVSRLLHYEMESQMIVKTSEEESRCLLALKFDFYYFHETDLGWGSSHWASLLPPCVCDDKGLIQIELKNTMEASMASHPKIAVWPDWCRPLPNVVALKGGGLITSECGNI